MEVLQVAHPKTPRKVIVEACLKLCLISPLQRRKTADHTDIFFEKGKRIHQKKI